MSRDPTPPDAFRGVRVASPGDSTAVGTSATFDVDAIVRVLGDAVAILEGADIAYGGIGSMAASVWGDVTWARERADIDFFIKRHDVSRAMTAFRDAGFGTSVPDEDWLVKAHREGVLVDLIFLAARTIELDDEMLRRSSVRDVEGCLVRIIPPEDFVVMQAMTVSRETPDHLFNGANVVLHTELDWDYFLQRSRGREARTLSLVAHAIAEGASVPEHVVEGLRTATRRLREGTLRR